MRTPALLAIGLSPIALGVLIGILVVRVPTVDVEIVPGNFTVDTLPPQQVPGTLRLDRPMGIRLAITNRDSVPRSVGVVVVPPGERVTVPVEECSPRGQAPLTFLPVR
jgi:hypothetical protein